MFWIPKKNHHHKHKNEKHHHGRQSQGSIGSQRGPAAAAVGTATMTRAMMSGDSPDTHGRTEPLLELKECPVAVASSSNGIPGKIGGETVTASVLVEPQPREQDPAGIASPPGDETAAPKRSRSTSTDDDTIETAETPLANKKLDNGFLDCTDGDPTKLLNNLQKKPLEEEEQEGCGVKCLYYTLQCCECTIM